MRSKRWSSVVLVGIGILVIGLSVAQAQVAQPPAGNEVLLTVSGAAGKTLRLTTSEFSKLPRQTVRVADRDQKEVAYEGILLSEVLRLVEAPLGDALHHHEQPTWYVLLEARDGYRALFALSEVDPAFSSRVILLADRKDGETLSAEEGPWRLVVPDEKRRARWIHQVISVRLGRL